MPKILYFSNLLLTLLITSACGPAIEGHKHNNDDSIFQNDNLIKKKLDQTQINELAQGIDNSSFKTIKSDALASVYYGVPEQGTNPWACGYIAAWHTIDFIRYIDKKTQWFPKNLNNRGQHPVSAEFDTAILYRIPGASSSAAMFIANADDKGIFRAGALPYDLATYVDERLGGNYQASLIEKDSLDKNELLNIIKTSINNNTPVLVVIQKNKGLKRLHYWTLVGYKGENILVLDSDSPKLGYNISTSDLLAYLDLSEFKKGMISKLPEIKAAAMVARMIGKKVTLAKEEDFNNLKRYNLITFEKI